MTLITFLAVPEQKQKWRTPSQYVCSLEKTAYLSVCSRRSAATYGCSSVFLMPPPLALPEGQKTT